MEQVDVVRPYRQLVQLPPVHLGCLTQEFLQPCRDRATQYPLAVFGQEDDVELQAVFRVGATPVVMVHASSMPGSGPPSSSHVLRTRELAYGGAIHPQA
jgi:hypothetical protein